ncbi:hypothetical protein B0J17DRAFT_627693 [Rhizoctonia solani]|nr:hypothetical protein B0J17DRAFT_627693 [Rhizoctonia solani]
MAASDDIYFDYYSSESLSSKWDFSPPCPTRRIQIIPPNAIDTKSSTLGGPPAYDPSSMSHTQQKQFRQKLLYAAPLSYYALRTLRPWCFGIDGGDETLSSWVSVSTAEGEERVNLGEVIAPWSIDNISLLDPPTWAFLIRLYNGLPEHYSRYRLALNDPYLPMLSSIPSTPKFSLITVLDLSNCDDLHDSNISQLKVLTSLCILDTSCTHLTDQAIRNLASTLLLQEPGPLRLQSWSLRNCSSVTGRSIESLGYFPMLCLLDLRGTLVEPQRQLYGQLNWDRNTIKSPREHFDFFWPQPQSNIPALIQDMNSAAYSTGIEYHRSKSESNDQPQRPWIIHIDRQYPSNWGLHRKPYWKSIPSNGRLPWYLSDYSDYSDDSNDSDEDVFEPDRLFIDGETLYGGSDSEGSLDMEEADLSSGEFDPSSPLQPTSSIFGDDETSTLSIMEVVSTISGRNDIISSGAFGSNAGQTHFPSRPVAPTTASQPAPTNPNQLVAEVVAQELAGLEPGVPRFYDARAQAGLAPPKARKRRKMYSSASSESYDSDEDREKVEKMEAEIRRRQVESVSDKGWQLMLLREPPEWAATEILIDTVRARKQHRAQGVPTQPAISSAKKRKVDGGEMAARWAQMKASNKPPSQVANQSVTSHHMNVARATNSHTHSLNVQTPASTQGEQAPMRRATLGRAPRPPGTIIRKSH